MGRGCFCTGGGCGRAFSSGVGSGRAFCGAATGTFGAVDAETKEHLLDLLTTGFEATGAA